MVSSEKETYIKNISGGSYESKKLKALIEYSDVMLWSILEDEKGNMFYEQVNEAFASIYGLTPTDYNGKNINDVNTEDEIRDFKKILARAKKNRIHNYHKERIEDSERKYYILRVIYIAGEGGRNHYIGSGVDVTDHIQAEDKLRISEKKYLDLVKYAPLAITRVNTQTDKFEFVNDEFVRLSGYTMEEYNSLSRDEYLQLLHDDDKDKLLNSYNKWMKDGSKGIFRLEYRFFNRYKKLIWLDVYFHAEVDEDGKIRIINQMYVDITDRKLSEEKVNMLAQAFKSTSEMISITGLDNKISFVNKAFIDIYGYSEEEIYNKDISILNSDKNPENIHDDVYKSTTLGVWKGELWNRTKDGREFLIQLSTSRIFDTDGKVIGHIGVARDITERIKYEENLKHMLKEKEVLLKEVYHRVKNNMQVINSLLNLQSLSVKDTEAKEMFQETRNRIKLMSGIHEKLYKSKNLSEIDFSGYIKDLTANLKNAYPVKSKHVDLIIDSNDIYLGIDKAIPCGLIINELVSNAYKYAFEGRDAGRIFIKLFNDEYGKYVLEVEDDGIGFPDTVDIKETDSLGMTLVMTFTEQLDGEIELIKNKGVKFIIKFK